MIIKEVERTQKYIKRFLVSCDFKLSNNCKNQYVVNQHSLRENLKINNDKIICLSCSRLLKSRTNGNCKYKFDTNFFKKIDTQEKAYLLGWIASDGNIRKTQISIFINKKDEEILYKLKKIICNDLPITKRKDNNYGIVISSKQIVNDVCKLLKIDAGKKCFSVSFPDIRDEFKISFLRGLWDGDGWVSKKSAKNFETGIRMNSIYMITYISNFLKEKINIKHGCYKTIDGGMVIKFGYSNGIKFLDALYNDDFLFLKRKFNNYIWWKNNYKAKVNKKTIP